MKVIVRNDDINVISMSKNTFLIFLKKFNQIAVKCIVLNTQMLLNQMKWIVNRTDSISDQRFTSVVYFLCLFFPAELERLFSVNQKTLAERAQEVEELEKEAEAMLQTLSQRVTVYSICQ